MILHLADDSIFLDYAIDQFEEVAPGFSIYLVNSKSPKRIRNVEKIIAAESNSTQYKDVIKNLSHYDAVILHALTYDKIKIVNKANSDVKFVWMFWGADGYYINKIIPILFSKNTQSLLDSVNNNSSFSSKIKKFLHSKDVFSIPYSLVRKGVLPADFKRRMAIKRMDYCAPVIEDDYYFIKRVMKLKCTLLPFSYVSIETLIPDFNTQTHPLKLEDDSVKILLGNSADPSNNHLDILYLLKNMNFEGEVICPLSYGNADYRDHLLKIGTDLLGTKFKPITDFLPLEKYQSLISSCGIVIMNHYRQQAMGNIVSSLWYGSKIFLNEKNPVYAFLKRKNAVVFSISNISVQSPSFTALDYKEIELNRNFVINNYSKENVLAKTKSLINTIRMDPQFSSSLSNISK
ncbi:MAG: TDP-N-acetylfucosamine:lipid II N-acetylfucosaminyltransferase [Ignavibacteriaceae bacterium]|jgi:hypothetical protein